MLRKIDRIILRVPGLPAAVGYYRDVLGMTLIRQDARLASFQLDGDAELLLHIDPDLPAEAVYYRVDSVRELYDRRVELKLTFTSPPAQAARGYRAAVRDPFGTVLLLLDRTTEAAAGQVVEDAKAPDALFAGVEPKVHVKRDVLVHLYEQTGRTADDLPYTPHFEAIYKPYAEKHGQAVPTRHEVWRHLLTLRKAGKLPRLGEARSAAPEVTAEDRIWLLGELGDYLGRRDRLPYTERFDELVDEFNKERKHRLSPHLLWRLVATLAK